MSKLSHPEIQSLVNEYGSFEELQNPWGRPVGEDSFFSDWNEAESAEFYEDDRSIARLSDNWPSI